MPGRSRHYAHTLREWGITEAGIGIDHHKQRDAFTSLSKMTGHLECYEPTERIANKNIGSLGLQCLDRFEMKICHFINAGARFFQTVGTTRLQTVESVRGLQMMNKVKEFQYISPHAVGEENWRLKTTSL